MIIDQFYLTGPNFSQRMFVLSELTGLSYDEIEQIVGRFADDHHAWPGELRGEVLVRSDGRVTIRHHFTKKKLWEGESNEQDTLCDFDR